MTWRWGEDDAYLHAAAEADMLPPMTICIGVLCEGGKAAVLVADRLVAHPHSGLSAEGPDPKIVRLCPGVGIAAAGEPPTSDFIKKCGGNLADPVMTEVAQTVYRAFAEVWHRRAGEVLTRLSYNMSYQEFLAAWIDRKIPQETFNQVARQAKEVVFTTSFLLAGVDGSRAHLYRVDEPHGAKSLDSPGFLAIGSGAMYAMPVLMQNQDVKHRTLAEAVYVAYEAKKAAEQHQHVGPTTDMVVIGQGWDVSFLGRRAIERLEAIYQSKRPPALTDQEISSIDSMLQSAS